MKDCFLLLESVGWAAFFFFFTRRFVDPWHSSIRFVSFKGGICGKRLRAFYPDSAIKPKLFEDHGSDQWGKNWAAKEKSQ